MLLDRHDRPLEVGQHVIYSDNYGPYIRYGLITRMNEKTKKIWVQETDQFGTPLMDSGGIDVEPDLLNYMTSRRWVVTELF